MKIKPVSPDHKVDPRDQETALNWYRRAKLVRVETTNQSDIHLLKKRGWTPVTGREAAQALPYVVFYLPRKMITFRSKPKGKK